MRFGVGGGWRKRKRREGEEGDGDSWTGVGGAEGVCDGDWCVMDLRADPCAVLLYCFCVVTCCVGCVNRLCNPLCPV